MCVCVNTTLEKFHRVKRYYLPRYRALVSLAHSLEIRRPRSINLPTFRTHDTRRLSLYPGWTDSVGRRGISRKLEIYPRHSRFARCRYGSGSAAQRELHHPCFPERLTGKKINLQINFVVNDKFYSQSN